MNGAIFEPSSLLWFATASLVLLLIPGPAVLFVVACSLSQGRKAGLVCVLGLETGTLLQLAAALLGISALVLSSAWAWDLIWVLGAAFLVYLGICKWWERCRAAHDVCNDAASLRRVFGRGVLVELLNPGTALFFMAFLPQFVDPALGNVAQQAMLLGLTFITLATIVDGAYALLAGSLGHWLHRSHRLARGLRVLAAALLIALGLSTALTGAPDLGRHSIAASV